MKMFNDKSVVKPLGERSIVDLDVFDMYTDKVTAKEIEAPTHVRLYKGIVSETNDPKLEGKLVVMSEFAGLHLAYTTKLAKLINNSDIIITTMATNANLNIEDLEPVDSKVLVKILEDDKEGLTISVEDPRKANMIYAEVLKVGENCTNCKKGDIVGIDPYEGEVLFSSPTEYRVLLDSTIKLRIEKN